MTSTRGYVKQDCSLARALEVVGDRWTPLILRDCFYGVSRFSDLQAHLDIPRAMLADRLARLVADGVLERRPGRSGPYYVLTGRGKGVWPAVFALAQWGEREFSPEGPRRLFSHVRCGTDITTSGWCPLCEKVPPPADLTVRQGPGADPTLRHDRVSEALNRGPHRLLTPLFPEPPA